MPSKIKSLTVVCQQRIKQYFVGEKYNGLKLDRIEDKSMEYPESITIIYHGYTKDNDLIFETINAPIEVEYQEI